MANNAHTILLSVREIFEREWKLTAGKDVTPGMWLEFVGSASPTVQPHSSASAIPPQKLIATEAPWRSGSDISDAYDTDGENVEVHYAVPGDHVYCLLKAGENVDAFTDRLGSDGAGGVQVATTYAFLRPLELVNNVYGSGYARIRCEVM